MRLEITAHPDGAMGWQDGIRENAGGFVRCETTMSSQRSCCPLGAHGWHRALGSGHRAAVAALLPCWSSPSASSDTMCQGAALNGMVGLGFGWGRAKDRTKSRMRMQEKGG